MATLVLTAAGAVLGGPIGAAVGAVIGAQVDRTLLAPKGRQGPRLGDLSVQTSSYGNALPRIFGTMRVAGTVIWATPLAEARHSSGSAKSGGKTTTYSYSGSFAVVLSARAIRSVGRIWADGNLLRGAGGDWKSDLAAFRLYPGDEGQAVDPLIASAEGIATTPAHRGLAYAVFEGLQLADYGNRIPSLTFELTADAGAVAIADIAAELSDGQIAASGGPALIGYAAGGDSVRGALETLAAACPMPLSDDGAVLRLSDTDVAALASSEFGATDGGSQPARVRDRVAADALPDAVALAYYEPARDYQTGMQRARRDGVGLRTDRIDLPAALSADTARGLAEGALDRAWIGREQATARVPWARIGARIGTLATIDGDGPWRIAGWTLEKMVLELALRREGAMSVPACGADAGRIAAAPDAAAGATRLVLLDLPALDDAEAQAPQLWLAAAGTGAGWRRAEASSSLDGGASWQGLGRTALPAVIGMAVGVPGSATPDLFDRKNAIEIDLLNDAMALQGADDDALVGGANAAMLGDELIQFGLAEQVGARRWRLSRLLRGRRGTEAAIDSHVLGQPFVLLDKATLLPLDVPLSALGTTVQVMAVGPGDGGIAATAACSVIGRAVRPPAPVALTAARLADGTIRFGWTRRSRIGWAWLDGSDAPLGSDGEAYRLILSTPAGVVRTADLAAPSFDYDPAMQAADGTVGAASFTIAVTMLGVRAASLPPATATWTL